MDLLRYELYADNGLHTVDEFVDQLAAAVTCLRSAATQVAHLASTRGSDFYAVEILCNEAFAAAQSAYALAKPLTVEVES
jgi:hypothetical protein